jgi:hypothetical protein
MVSSIPEERLDGLDINPFERAVRHQPRFAFGHFGSTAGHGTMAAGDRSSRIGSPEDWSVLDARAPLRQLSRRMDIDLPVAIQRQPDYTTCGPTSLHAVYSYFGDSVTLPEVILRSPGSRAAAEP